MSSPNRWIFAGVVVVAIGAVAVCSLHRGPTPTSGEDAATGATPADDAAPGARPKRARADAASTTPVASVTVFVRVVAADKGLAIAGAQVDGRFLVGDRVVFVDAQCDAEGLARIAAPAEWTALGMDVHARGFAGKTVSRRGPAEFAGGDFRVELDRGCVVEGRVRDSASGAPIAGATARFGFDPPETTARTDAEGRFRTDEAPYRFRTIRVSAPAHVAADLDVGSASVAPIEVALDPAGRVRGIVRLADGRPAGGAQIDVRVKGRLPSPEGAYCRRDGSYELDGIPPQARFDVNARRYDGARVISAVRRGLVLSDAGDVASCDLVLAAQAHFVVFAMWPDGEPIVNAQVRVGTTESRDEQLQGATDDAGVATFAAVPEGRRSVVVQAAGFEPFEGDVVLAGGDKRTVDARLRPGIVVSGIVVDDRGEPIAGAAVSEDGADDAPKFASRGDGTFRIACRDSEPRTIRASHKTHEAASIENVASPCEGLRVVLPRMATATCRLVYPDGVAELDIVEAWWRAKPDDSYVKCGCQAEDAVLVLDVPPCRGQTKFSVLGCVAVERDVDPAPGAVVDWGDVVLVAAPK